MIYLLLKWKPSREAILGIIAFVIIASIIISALQEL